MVQYWIMKSEPTSYSIDDLKRDKCTPWEGVRNYQARNYMRDDMHEGDVVFFYHSACAEPGIVGEGKVGSKPYPDKTALDKKSKYFDPKSTNDDPRWFLVDVCYAATYPRTIALRELSSDPSLKGLEVTRRGSRLSISPVASEHAKIIRMKIKR